MNSILQDTCEAYARFDRAKKAGRTWLVGLIGKPPLYEISGDEKEAKSLAKSLGKGYTYYRETLSPIQTES